MALGVNPRTSFFLLGSLIHVGCSDELKPDNPLPYPKTQFEIDSGVIRPADAGSDVTVDAPPPLADAESEACVPQRCEAGLLDTTRGSPLAPLCISFEEIHADVGLADVGSLNGLSVIDFDNANGMDLFLLSNGASNRILQNEPTSFLDLGTQTGLNFGGDHRAAAWADYDSDGDPDLFLTGDSGSHLYKNDNGVFRSQATSSGINDANPGKAAVFLGHDLFLATINGTRFYRHLGGDSFQEDTVAAGLEDFDDAEAIAVTDYDNDGRDDIYLAKAVGLNRLFHQRADGTYESVEFQTGIVGNGVSVDAEWVRYNGEILPSLYIANWGSDSAFPRNQLFVNQGDGTFADQAQSLGIQDPGDTSRVAWGDALTEERPFLFLGRWDQQNLLYIPNLDANGDVVSYTEASHPLGMDETGQTIGAEWLDYDADGKLDLIVGMFNRGLFLYHNITHEVSDCPETP